MVRAGHRVAAIGFAPVANLSFGWCHVPARRLLFGTLAVAVLAGLAYVVGPSFVAPQNDEALHACSKMLPDEEMARVEWRAGAPSGWWCQNTDSPEERYLFWWN